YFTSAAAACISTLSLHDALPIFNNTQQPLHLIFLKEYHVGQVVTKKTLFKHPTMVRIEGQFFVNIFYDSFNGCRCQGKYWNIRRSEEHTSELQSRENLVCRLLLE